MRASRRSVQGIFLTRQCTFSVDYFVMVTADLVCNGHGLASGRAVDMRAVDATMRTKNVVTESR